MTESAISDLEKQLENLCGSDIPPCPAQNINAALQIADILQERGFDFALKDLCPKSLTDTMWRAKFIKKGEEFRAEDPSSAAAVCAAAVKALESCRVV